MAWDQQRIRRTFLDYFAKHATLPHKEVASSPIIPRDDPTLLFTNAGMNQFKSLLLGQEKRDYTRACSVQKCMRVGGKHNDLDAVGKDGRHLTWFEMLGNWSFGDYYKQQTIRMAWDLSVNVYGLDPERIYVSVYKTDDEAFALWADDIGVDPKRIYRFGDVEKGDDENFWSMGPTGPCGPCTELFYDLGPEGGTGPTDYMGGDGDRYMEFWNNVFMESERFEDGTIKPLSMQSVDTGMGMERITMILQGKVTAYETDIFTPIIQETMGRTRDHGPGASFTHPRERIDLQVIADHIRSLTFTLSEGGTFGRDGREYVLRRILRRAVRHGRRLGFEGPFLHSLVPAVASVFEGVYDLPASTLANTAAAIKEEEARFFRTIDRGMGRIHAVMGELKGGTSRLIPGETAFELYDTYGFPVDLTRIEAEEHGFSVDEAGFTAAMTEQRDRSRASQKFYDDDGEWHSLAQGSGTHFAGYGLSTLDTAVVRWRSFGEGETAGVEFVLASTPLYAESGGEVADRGTLTGPGFAVIIDDVQKLNGIIHHRGRLVSGTIALNAADHVTVKVDTVRRGQKTIHHTATHLLHAALKTCVAAHIEQKGSVVEPDRLRFDFSHSEALSPEQVEAVEAWVNDHIRRNEAVAITEDVPIEEARAQGVVALFGEKYGEVVRTVRAGTDSFELCGGNHVNRTGDIGHLRVTGQSAVAAGVRRIEAVVGHAADAVVTAERQNLRDAAGRLKVEPARLGERIDALQADLRELKKALDKARKSGGDNTLDTLLAAATQVDGVTLVAGTVAVDDREGLTALVDRLRDKLPGGVVVLGAELDGKATVVAAVGPALSGDKRFHAGNIVRETVALVDGKGGGRPDFAQGGGKAPERLPEALAAVPGIVARLAGR